MFDLISHFSSHFYSLLYSSHFFLKFVVRKINSEMVKSEMVVLIGRKKTNAGVLVDEREKERKLT
jgi:hypothetical protein